MEPQIFTLHNQILEAVLPEVAFPFASDGKKHTIALVGGGGKTTLMYFLGDTYAKQNIPTLITTTTHIRMPEDGSYVTTMEAACRRWDAQRYAVVGVPDQAGKLKALPGKELHAYQKRAKQILVEADFLVNLYEDQESKESARTVMERLFVNKTAKNIATNGIKTYLTWLP